MKRIFPPIALLLVLLLALAGCSSAETPRNSAPDPLEIGQDPSPSKPLKVIATIFPPYDFVREIAGDRVEVTMLLSPGAESHSYAPTPQDIIAIQSCDVFLYVGGDTDLWVARILESMDTSEMTLLPLMSLVDVVEEELVEGMEHAHDDHEDEDDHDEEHAHAFDEHVWTSPVNAMTIVREISATLSTLDPENSTFYMDNAQAYLSELELLDQQFREMVEDSPRRTIVFGDRFPFRYLADAYGLEYFAAFPGCSTETDASSATVAFLIDKVREEEIPVVFHIELSNERMADAICEGTGASKLLLHSCHNVTRDEFQRGVTYLEVMHQNLAHLKEALTLS